MKLRRRKSGFTLIELLVVMAIIATLLTLAVPRYFASLEKSREAVLHANLTLMRETLDKYYGDKGVYPASLDELVASRYLRSVPTDPITQSNTTWIVVPPAQPDMGGVYDVKSGAQGNARDGTAFLDW
jgi:general secretion pathway protein G